MVTLNFCNVCGAKKVQDVKEQLERLITLKEFSPAVCNICCEPIPSSASHTSSQMMHGLEEDMVENEKKDPSNMSSSESDSDEATIQDDDVIMTEEDEDDDVTMTEEDEDEEEDRDSMEDKCDTKELKADTESFETKLEYTDRVVDDARFRLKALRPELAQIAEVVNDNKLPFKCKVCKQAKQYDRIDKLVFHLSSSHFENKELSQTPYQCNICCDIQFRNIRQWSRHAKVYQCRDPSCRKRFESKVSFVAHEKRHSASDLRPYKCSQCKKGFLKGSNLLDHLRNVHHAKEPLSIKSEHADDENVQKESQGVSPEGNNRNKQVKQFKCRKCSISFMNEDILLGHTRKVHCTPIERALIKEEQDEDHITDQSGDTQITVESGDTQVTVEMDEVLKEQKNEDVKIQKSSLRLEIKQLLEDDESAETMFKCTKCDDVSFDAANTFISHAAVHVGDDITAEPYQCSRCCKQIFKYFAHWRTHVKPHTCTMPDCNYRAPNRFQLNQHFTCVHSNAERKFKCGLCPKAFHRKCDLQSHTKTVHEKLKRFTCSFCGLQYFRQSELTRHERSHTNKKPFQCNVCGQAYSSAKSLEVHKMDHTGDKPFVCEQCGFATKRKDSLQAHQQTHLEVRKYQCDICGMQISKKSLLKIHKRKHTGEKTFKCQYCDEYFMHRDTRNSHEQRHPEWTGVRNYVCNICGQGCVRNSKLQRHMLTHTGKKSLQCMKCEFRTNYKSSLREHQKIHDVSMQTGEKRFQCMKCDYKTNRKSNLGQHQKVHNRKKATEETSARLQRGVKLVSSGAILSGEGSSKTGVEKVDEWVVVSLY